MPPATGWAIIPPIRPTAAARFVYLMWFVMLCDPQWWVASVTAGFVTKLPTPLYGLLLVLVAFHPPKSWFPPLLAFIAYTVAVIPMAYDAGLSIEVAKMLVAYYILAIGALALLRSVSMSVPLIAGQMMYAYLWWVLWGAKGGQVPWHPSLGNYDGYGPLMVIGIGSCYYFGLATKVRKERLLAFVTAIGCVVGLVGSFARGAVLAGGGVAFWIWVRSRNKARATMAGAVALVGLVIAGFLVPSRSEEGRSFFQEMATVTQGSDDATRGDREVLWALARRVFLDHPLFGVGANNFGAYAAQRFRPGETGGAYDENPATLYGRQLHSTFYQILCEYGIVGSGIFLWMLVDFWIRNRALRKERFRSAWAERSGGRLDLHALSLGLECAMVGFLTSGLFYNQIFNVHWFYTVIAVNTLLFYHARPSLQGTSVRVGR